MNKNLTALLTASAALVFPAVAQAEDVTASPVAQRNIAIAQQYWGASISNYRVEVAPLTIVEVGQVAEAGQPGNWQKISPEFWAANEPRYLCVIETHEYGHSLGHGHDTDPSNVMYFAPSEDSVPGCNAAYPSHEEEEDQAVTATQEAANAAVIAAYEKASATTNHAHHKAHKHNRKKRHHS